MRRESEQHSERIQVDMRQELHSFRIF